MAEKDKNVELSINNYFDEGLADGTEPNNPFEILEPEQSKKKKVVKRNHIKRKRILVTLCILLILVLAAVIFIFIQHRRNDGRRYARKLSENIGE